MTVRDKDGGLHYGHRGRLRRRFQQEGLEGFEDHQVLELLLFNALPRQDTNKIAHRLLQRYGSLSAALEADPKDIATIPGMGQAAAAFLSLIPPLTRYYLTDRSKRIKKPLNEIHRSLNYVIPLMAGRTEEVFYVLCLDSQCRLLFPALISHGTVKEALVHPRHVVEAALRHKAASVILAHNHPSGHPEPSRSDIQFTQLLQRSLIPIGIRVLDHIIVTGNEGISMAQEGFLDD
ncbi:MAG: DNA repair protein RadC [Magnetococcales bacterium]|nr:DNA repair protein RadC [Magnetococcales bacterium]